MRGTFIFIVLLFCSSVSAHIYYVQDPAYNENASDMNRGTDILLPWATWQKAFSTARAGDTVYFRGGSWFPTADNYGCVTEHHPAINRGHYGTPSRPICFFAYPPDVAEGNMPVLDCKNVHPTTSSYIGLRIADARYIHFRGLQIKNVRSWPMENGEMWCAGVMAQHCEHLTLENMTASYIGGSGFFLKDHDTLYLTNCDAHHNCDSLDLQLPGNDADGFNVQALGEVSDTSRISYISGCRAWNNSDDGFDISSTKQLEVHDCWSWNNGALQGDACGFKLCLSHLQSASKRRIYNCIAAYNEAAGFIDLNLHEKYGPFMEYFNNTVYKCGEGFGSGPGNVFDCHIHPASVIYRNNISYAINRPDPATFKACDYGYPVYVTQDHNSWVSTGDVWHTRDNPAYHITDDDFVSLDSAQLRWPRGADGSLPEITFLSLKGNSDLVDGGIDVGLAYQGQAPDLGAMEYGTLSVDLLSPEKGEAFVRGDRIAMQARAEDAYNEISEVNFYNRRGDRELVGRGQETGPSIWEFSWESDTIGFQNLLAVAMNAEGDVACSSLVQILIYPHSQSGDHPFTIVPNPNDGRFVLQLNEPLESFSDIQIVSMGGEVLATDTMARTEIAKLFDLSRLRSGAYTLVFENSEQFRESPMVIIINDN